jgi:rod shape-determining protein MreB
VRVLNLFRPPLVAIDVGTATTRVCFGSSRIVERPSVVRGVGRPVMRAGVVADIAGVASVVEELIDHGRKRTWRRRPAAVVCAPTDVSVQEREALIEAVVGGGASVATVVPEPLAAAIGAGIDVASEYATAIVDIGEGVTDLAVIRNASIIRSAAFRIGCGTLRAAIHDWLELQHHSLLSDEAVESVVRDYCMKSESLGEVGMLLDPVIDRIAQFVADTIHELPDDLAAEVIESGIHVTGGGAMLNRLIARIERVVGLPLTRADEPLTAVIRGAGDMLRVLELRSYV